MAVNSALKTGSEVVKTMYNHTKKKETINLHYCTTWLSLARGGTRDKLDEIWTSATLRVDRGHARILAKAKIQPLVLTMWCGAGTESGQYAVLMNQVTVFSLYRYIMDGRSVVTRRLHV